MGYGYPAYGYYGKRSADAEPKADADAYYGVYGYPYAAGYAGYAYGAYPYAYGAYCGKRSADAQPEADAYYGYYGYARPYAYGAYGYGAYGRVCDKLNATQLRSSKANIKYQ